MDLTVLPQRAARPLPQHHPRGQQLSDRAEVLSVHRDEGLLDEVPDCVGLGVGCDLAQHQLGWQTLQQESQTEQLLLLPTFIM